jgi:hypothetical protein
MLKKNTDQTADTSRQADAVPVYSFVKEETCWYLDLPQYLAQGGRKAELQLIEGADELLNLFARRKKTASVQMDVVPFEGADVLELVELCDAPKGGGMYLIRTCRNRTINKTIWLCDVTLFVFGDMPERIYIKAVENRSTARHN